MAILTRRTLLKSLAAAPAVVALGRPGIARVTKGRLIEYRGAVERTLQVGDTWYENADTVHWFRNPSSSEAAELWVVDVVLKKK